MIRKKAYWIFDDEYIVPTFLSVSSFLTWCDIPVVLLYYGNNLPKTESWFYHIIAEKKVSLIHINSSFFSLPVSDYNNVYYSSIRNRELRFYVTSLSGPNDIAYCFDSDLVFNEKCKKLIELDWDGKPSIYGCKERKYTYENVLYFERGITHTVDNHIYPENAKLFYDTIFDEDTDQWLCLPQLNNGVLVFCNVPSLSEAWRYEHNKGLFYAFVNPGADQVTLIAALSKLTYLEVIYLDSVYNSMGKLKGAYGIFHATGGQWRGEIINALSEQGCVKQSLSDCAKTYLDIIKRTDCRERLLEYFYCTSKSPTLYYSIPGFFFFQSIYDFIFQSLPENGLFVEIGTYKGKSICYMAECKILWKKNLTIFSIDNYSNKGYSERITYKEAKTNLENRGVLQFVNLIDMDSVSASSLFGDGSIDGVFIDGDSMYDSVKSDLHKWFVKIRKGGIIAGNNYTRIQSVRKAVDDFAKEMNINWNLLEQSYYCVKQ